MSDDVLVTKIVDSPDDGGYWIDQWSSEREKSRASKRVYRSLTAAKHALKTGKVQWEAWGN
jgi:hypothetical protein